ncbi:MAG: peptide-methionine (R)-S-oxide reductase MsrB [Flavobacteriaceae bacterium]
MSNYKVTKTEDEWRKQLSEEEYRILRQKGTERPHTGKFNLHFEKGAYVCAGCKQQLFESDSKFDAHCGWPSFDESIKGTVEYVLDKTHSMTRTEIVCSNCGGHLGHVFNDGPTETGTRYCVNSVSIDFKTEDE